ncbi:MAG: hypothetical protein IJ038_01440 [Clostridia bacterium]|nr:hypothetical protein [Clostridia bacterium]
MNKKKLLTGVLCGALLVIAIILFAVRIFDIHFNFITYHSFEQDGYSFEFKGSSDTVRKVKVKLNGKKLCSLPFDSSSEIFSNEFGYSAKFEDINFDGIDDLLLPCAVDADGDIHSSVFLANEDGAFDYDEALASLSNLSSDADISELYTEETSKEILAEGTESSPEFYVITHKISRHSFIEGKLVTLEERSIVYYSENDYYCYSVYEYDEEYGELKYVDDKWFEPNELEKYELTWD